MTAFTDRKIIYGGPLTPLPPGGPPWEPNHIDYRHSVLVASNRADAGDETLEICAHCGCEVDVAPAPHRPGCRGIGERRASSASAVSKPPTVLRPSTAGASRPVRVEPDGRDLLGQMDVGERLAYAPLEEADADGSPSTGPSEGLTLACLADGPKRMRDIAAERGISQTLAGAQLTSLLAKGLITRVSRGVYAAVERAGTVPAPATVEREAATENGVRSDVAPPPSRSEEEFPDPGKDAYAIALIAAVRAFADTLEEELALL